MTTRFRLIDLIADGCFHSGQSLGRQLGISRAAVWKHMQALAETGPEVHAVRGRGYRLSQAFVPLAEEAIRAGLGSPVVQRLERLDVVHDIDSTNEYLKRIGPMPGENGVGVCVAEWQRAGRGRRGRAWVSPYGANLYLSLAAQAGEALLSSGGLSLAVAIAVTEALQDCGVQGLGLKWPNDIFYQGRKLAGILLDLSGESGGPYKVVIGVGVNLKMPAGAALGIDQPWTDLSEVGLDLDRNHLAGLIISGLIRTMDLFNEYGLRAFTQDWQRFDLVSGRTVELRQEHESMIRGVARGIDDRGALLIERNGVTRSYMAGEVSIRLP